MYTSYLGKKFLKRYNDRNKTELTPKEFFDSVQFPLFFDDKRHLLHVHGSTFFQKVGKEYDTNERESIYRLKRLHKDVYAKKISASTYVGYAAEKTTGTTSGQVTTINREIDEDEIFASWIGEALAIGVNGGFVMLIDNDEILWSLYNGWKYYRKYLSQTPNIKDRQIETWNGQWLCHSFSKNFDENYPEDNFNIETENVQGKLAIPTIKWTWVILSLSRKFPNSQITAYAYNLSQTNTTLGFINLYLKEIHEIYEMQDQLILESDTTILSDLDIGKFEPFYYFKDACAFGTIGLKALEPAKLREFMPKGSVQYAQGKDYKFKDEESYFNYKLFKIWIYAMLNKKEIIQLADQLALILLKHEQSNKEENRGKTGKGENVKKVVESRYFKEFAENIKPVINKKNSSELEEIVQKSYLEITSDNFPLFLTLVRFQYQIHKSNS